MTTNPATVRPSDPVSTAKEIFESEKVHHLPVVENGVLVGIVSSSDLLKFHLLDGDAAALTSVLVDQLMEPEPLVLMTGACLRDAATALSIGGYHALPVVDSDRALVGIVTTGDLLTYLLQQIPRGDGSIHETALSSGVSGVGDDELSRTVKEAEQAAGLGGNPDRQTRAILHLRDRNRLLEHLRTAAELYLRSGNGEREHSVLVKCLADL